MPTFACPDCGADIEDHLASNAASAHCPFCGGDLPQIAASESGIAADISAGPGAPLYPGGRVRIIESAADRRVLFVPEGGTGRSASMGCFALFWIGFMVMFTFAMIMGEKAGPAGEWDGLLAGLVVCLFWAVGLGIGWWWVKLRFTRLHLLLEGDRFVIQRTLFGRSRIEEHPIGPDAHATLIERYRQNERPVYSVAIVGAAGQAGAAKFATALDDDEKTALVDYINDFLDRRDGRALGSELPRLCSECGAPLPGAEEGGLALICLECGASHELPLHSRCAGEELVPALRAADLTPESPVTINEDSPGCLRFSVPFVPRGTVRAIVASIAVVVLAVFLYSGLSHLRAPVPGGWFVLVWIASAVFSALPALFPAAILAMLLFGRVTLEITPQEFSCRWHVGSLGRTKRLAAASIERVVISEYDTRGGQQPGTRVIRVVARDDHGALDIPYLWHSDRTAREVAGLIRGTLHTQEHIGDRAEREART